MQSQSVTTHPAKQPTAMYFLFFTTMWEYFSYYGMRALLILFMTKAFLFSDDKSYIIYGAYTSLIYVTPILGGFIADKVFGFRRAIILGGILMALGHFTLAFGQQFSFFLALGFLISGYGLFKPNVASMLGLMYGRNDPRRDAGFVLFYVGANFGGFLAPILCAFVADKWGWHYGFGLAGIGMLTGLIVFTLGQKTMGDKGLPPSKKKLNKVVFIPGLTMNRLIIIGAFLLAPISALVLNKGFAGPVLSSIGLIVGIMLLWIMYNSTHGERIRLIGVMLLMGIGTLFWAFDQQMGSSINLFTDRDINRVILGWHIPTAMFQAVNPMVVLIAGPLFAALWTYMARRNREPMPSTKFGFALLQLTLGFACLSHGALNAEATGQASMLWLLVSYLFVSTGELCLEPIGLSMTTHYSPLRVIGVMVGTWYIITGAIANFAAGKIAEIASVPNSTTASAPIYHEVFHDIMLIALACTVITFIVAPFINKLLRTRS